VEARLEGSWQARRDSNPQHADLESAALPIGATGLHEKLLTRLELKKFTKQKLRNIEKSPDANQKQLALLHIFTQ
jgi:hypothetical protein